MKYAIKIICLILFIVSGITEVNSQNDFVNVISYEHMAYTPDVNYEYDLTWVPSDIEMVFTKNYDVVNISGEVYFDDGLGEIDRTFRITKTYEDKEDNSLHIDITSFSGATGFIRFYKKGRVHVAAFTMDSENSVIFFRDRQ